MEKQVIHQRVRQRHRTPMCTLKIKFTENLDTSKDIAEKYVATVYEMSLVELARKLEKTKAQSNNTEKEINYNDKHF